MSGQPPANRRRRRLRLSVRGLVTPVPGGGSGRSQRPAIMLAAIALSVVTIFPPCRKNDVVFNPETQRVEAISPWIGYVPIVWLPHPQGSKGGPIVVAWELAALHFSAILLLTAISIWWSGARTSMRTLSRVIHSSGSALVMTDLAP
jgi:hypothetical protein